MANRNDGLRLAREVRQKGGDSRDVDVFTLQATLGHKQQCHRWCLTKNRRVVSEDGSLRGYLNKDYTYYREAISYKGNIYLSGGYRTVRYEQVNKNNTVVFYACDSDASGTCMGNESKELFQYIRTN